MNTPIIWIIFPAAFSIVLWVLRGQKRLVNSLGLGTAVVLVILARILPIGVTIKIGPWAFKIVDTLNVLGREFIITTAEQPLIALLFSVAALWFLGAFSIQITSFFIPLSLGMVALLIAALAVEPFLYAALLIEIAVLLSIPMLAPLGEQSRQGVLRFLIFQTAGMPFILFTGWMLAGIETGPADTALVTRAAVMLGLGFAFLLGVFPFYTWIPLLAEQAHAYVTGFIFVILPTVVLFLGLTFIHQYTWLAGSPLVFEILRVAGTLMVATGGILAAFQRNYYRVLGYTVMVMIGFAMLAIGLKESDGISIFGALLLPYIIALWLWTYSLVVFRRAGSPLTYASGADGLHRFPFASISLLLACFTLAGLPFLAGFPFRLSLLVNLTRESYIMAVWVFAGSLGLLMAGVRSLAALSVVREVKGWQVNEKPGEAIFLTLGSFFLLLLGWFPQWFLPFLMDVLKGFSS
jgi:NADH-quinone oxidoreductase subunit N